ncbi:MAG TPA: radical SAM protein [Syntrophales bacterium]|nr:radical SAM protein [Syntrophales bacterium]
MDLIIIAGMSKTKGSQFSTKGSYLLTRDGMVMNYSNLRKVFDLNHISDLSDYNTPYLAGIHLYNFLSQRGIKCVLINFLDLETKQLEKYLEQNPKAIALSTTFLTNLKAVKEVTDIIRKYSKDIKIILGGPFVYNSYLLYQMKDSEYDTNSCVCDFFFLDTEKSFYEDIDLFVVEEQGEETLWRVMESIINCKSYHEIPNVAYYKNDKLIFTERKPENNDFTENIVSWNEVPEEYIYPIFPVRGSRGCPFKCKFCNFSTGKTFRLKNLNIIAQEISALIDTGKVKMIRFTDDNLFLNERYVEDYCTKIIETGKEIKWTSFIRATSITKDNVILLKDSGCILAQIGIESGDENILREMNKKDSPENYLRVIELLNTYGISTQLYFIIGFPGETAQSIENTIQLINKFHSQGPAINELMVFPFVFAPLSPVYEADNRKRYNLKGYMTKWTHYTMTSEQAQKYAQELFLRVEHTFPHYGIEEFLTVEIGRLKKISQLRSQIRKYELIQNSQQKITRSWQELREVVCENEH